MTKAATIPMLAADSVTRVSGLGFVSDAVFRISSFAFVVAIIVCAGCGSSDTESKPAPDNGTITLHVKGMGERLKLD